VLEHRPTAGLSRRTMDDHQKRVLRWKRHLVAKNVKWNDDFVTGLKQRDLLCEAILPHIQVKIAYCYTEVMTPVNNVRSGSGLQRLILCKAVVPC